MNTKNNGFTALADQAGRGDPRARSQMESDMIPIVRRVIRRGVGASQMERHILNEAHRWQEGTKADQDWLVRRVTRSLCANVIANVGPIGQREQGSAETVLDFPVEKRRGA